MQDRPNFRRFLRRDLPLGENPFSKVGPLDLRLAKNSEMSSNPIRSVALRVGSINLLPDASSQEPLFFFSLIDITQREEEEGRIRRQLNFDAMTGLPSRYSLISQVESHIQAKKWLEICPFCFRIL